MKIRKLPLWASAFMLSIACALNVEAKSDPLSKYKLNLGDPDVCTIYYSRNGSFQTVDSLKLGVKADGTDSLAAPYSSIKYLYDGKVDSLEYCAVPNQGFLIFDFGEKGIDFYQMRLWNNGYYKKGEQTTVYNSVYGDLTDTTGYIALFETRTNVRKLKKDMFRTNGTHPNFPELTVTNNWVTGSVDKTQNEPGSFCATVPAGKHYKYRYLVVYDWSYYFYISEVEVWATLLKDNTYTDLQLDLDRAIAQAESYASEFKMSDAAAVSALNLAINDAKKLLEDDVKDETTLSTAVSSLTDATNTFMSAITYQLGENDFYCALSTPDGMYGLKLASEDSTIGSYKGKVLVTCDPSEALPFSVNKGKVVNSQQAYQLSTADGVVIQTGSNLMLVNASQVTSTNTAAFVFTQRYSDGENALYDMKAGDYFYYIDNDQLKATATFPEYEDYNEIQAYLFQLTPSEYKKTEEEAAVNFAGWEFNDAAKEVTEVYGDTLGRNAGKIVDGWRLNKWRNYTRVDQLTTSGNGYMTISVNNPYYERADTLAANPLIPAIDTDSKLTSANNGAGICREYGKYANAAQPDPVNQVRDSSNLIVVNPIYCPYIAVKMAPTSADVDMSGYSFSFFIKKNGVEPGLNMNNMAGRKGDVYYWKLTDVGFTVGQVGYSAQYMGINAAFTTTKDAIVFDWIRPFESVDAIPEETIPAADLAAIVDWLPENPVYEEPEPEPEYEIVKVKDLGKYITAVDVNKTDLSVNYASQLSQVTDGDTITRVDLSGNSVYILVALPEDLQQFQSIKVHYDPSKNQYATNVFFYTSEDPALKSYNYACYVSACSGLWTGSGSSAILGEVVNDAENHVVTITNTKSETVKYVAFAGGSSWDSTKFLSMTELELYYYDKGATGMATVTPDESAEAEGIFDITGRRLNEIGAPGLYIVNGKKVMIR